MTTELKKLSLADIAKIPREELVKILDLTDRYAAVIPEDKLSIYEPNSSVIEEFHKSKARVRAVISGNRGGKTAALCVEAAIKATGIVPKSLENVYPKRRLRVPSSIRLNASDFDNGVDKVLEPEMKRWLPHDSIESEDKSCHTIQLKNGSFIEFMSYAQPIVKFGGAARDFVGFDEIPPPDVVKENMMRTVDRAGDVVYSFSPIQHQADERGQTTNNAIAIAHFYESVFLKAHRHVTPTSDTNKEGGFPWIEIFQIDVFENKHVNLETLKEEMKTMSDSDIQTRVKGHFQHLAGLIYGEEYDEARHLARHYKHDPNWPVYIAIDPHPNYKKNPHHITYMSIDKSGRMFVCDELKVSGVVGEIASAMEALESHKKYWVVWRLIDPIAKTPDPITGTCLAQELAVLGYPTRAGSKDLYSGILKTKEALKGEQLFIVPECKGHRWEIAHYIWKNNKPLDKDDHFMENMRRLVVARPQWIDKVGYLAALNREPNWPKY